MMLGKRARPQIKRTTSMTGITVDLGHVEAPAPADPQNPIKDVHAAARVENMVAGSNGYDPRFLAATVSPRIHRRSSGEFMETAHFLRTCGLCQRRLQPGRDIYMYRYYMITAILTCSVSVVWFWRGLINLMVAVVDSGFMQGRYRFL